MNQGTYTALITPFKENGDVDVESFERNIGFQFENNVQGVLVAGTTGESPTMHEEEFEKLVNTAVEAGFTIANTGENNTEKSLSKTRFAENAGAGAILLVDCYYNGPSSMELRREYYSIIAGKTDLEAIAYVIPGRSGTELSPEDLAILAQEHSNIVAVKEATGNLDRMCRTRALMPDFAIYSGDDDLTMRMGREVNAAGVISVTSNVAPKAVTELCECIRNKNWTRAQELHDALSPLFSAITVKTSEETSFGQVPQKFRNPLPYKALMQGLGIDSGVCRRPLGKLSKNALEKVRLAVKQTWENNQWVLKPLADYYGIDVSKQLEEKNWRHCYD